MKKVFLVVFPLMLLVGCEQDHSGETRQVDPTQARAAAEAAKSKGPSTTEGATPQGNAPAVPQNAKDAIGKVASGYPGK
ncbi:MAG: hypothetical protein ABUL49_01385 [bacterium]